MSSAQLLAVDHARQLEVQLSSHRRTRPLLRGGGDQGMCSAYAVPGDDQDAGLDCLVEGGRLVRDRGELADGQIGAEGDREQQPPDWGGQPFYARTEQVLDRIRHGQLLAGAGQVAFGQRAPEFEREQWVAERRVDQAPKQRPREAQTEPLVQKLPNPAQAQTDPPRGARRSTARSPARAAMFDRGAWRAGSGRRTSRAVAPRTPALRADGESSHCTSSIAIRSDRRSASARKRLRKPSAIARSSGGRPVGSARRTAISSARRCGVCKSTELRAVDPVEKIDEPRECQPRRRSVRARREHPDPTPTGSGDTGLPERRLADPRAAREDKCPASLSRRGTRAGSPVPALARPVPPGRF